MRGDIDTIGAVSAIARRQPGQHITRGGYPGAGLAAAAPPLTENDDAHNRGNGVGAMGKQTAASVSDASSPVNNAIRHGPLRPMARVSDPTVSHAAAGAAAALASQHRARIMRAMAAIGPAGKDSIAAAAGLDGNQTARRLPELRRMGLVDTTGDFDLSRAGRLERVWRLTAQAEAGCTHG